MQIRKFFYLIPNPILELSPFHQTSRFEKKCDCKSRKLQVKNATDSVLNLRFGHYESMSLRFLYIPRFSDGFWYLETKHNFTLKIPYFHLEKVDNIRCYRDPFKRWNKENSTFKIFNPYNMGHIAFVSCKILRPNWCIQLMFSEK